MKLMTLQEEIHSIQDELHYYAEDMMRIARYVNEYKEVKCLLELVESNDDRCITMYMLSDNLVDLVLSQNYMTMYPNKNMMRSNVLETSSIVDAETMHRILESCSRLLIIDEILADL